MVLLPVEQPAAVLQLLEKPALRLDNLREVKLVVGMPRHFTSASNDEKVLTIGLSETS